MGTAQSIGQEGQSLKVERKGEELVAGSLRRRLPALVVMGVLGLLALGSGFLAQTLGGLPEPGVSATASVASYEPVGAPEQGASALDATGQGSDRLVQSEHGVNK